MKAKTVLRKTTTVKFFIMIIAACFLFAVPQLSAQSYGTDGGQGGQDQGYGGQQGQQQEQQGQQQGYQQPPQQQETDISHNDLEKYAEAQSEVNEIRSEFSSELEGVDNREKAQELQDKYSQQMIEAIADTGLSVREYNEISLAIQNDSDMQKKVEELAN